MRKMWRKRNDSLCMATQKQLQRYLTTARRPKKGGDLSNLGINILQNGNIGAKNIPL